MIQTGLLCSGFCLSLALGDVITSGSIYAHNPALPMGDFSLSGSDFTVEGPLIYGLWGPFSSCGLCPLDTTMSVNATIFGYDNFLGGSATIAGVTYPHLEWASFFANGPLDTSRVQITGPPILLNAGPGRYNSTFSLRGRLCGRESPIFPNEPCSVVLDLSGSGEVAVDVGLQISPPGSPVPPLLHVDQVTYTFVPESPTITMTAFAMALLVFAATRSRENAGNKNTL